MEIGIEHPDIRFETVYGMSECAPHAWWDNGNAFRFGYRPRDCSDDYTDEVLRRLPKEIGDSLAIKYQGGSFVSTESGGDPTKPDME